MSNQIIQQQNIEQPQTQDIQVDSSQQQLNDLENKSQKYTRLFFGNFLLSIMMLVWIILIQFGVAVSQKNPNYTTINNNYESDDPITSIQKDLVDLRKLAQQPKTKTYQKSIDLHLLSPNFYYEEECPISATEYKYIFGKQITTESNNASVSVSINGHIQFDQEGQFSFCSIFVGDQKLVSEQERDKVGEGFFSRILGQDVSWIPFSFPQSGTIINKGDHDISLRCTCQAFNPLPQEFKFKIGGAGLSITVNENPNSS